MKTIFTKRYIWDLMVIAIIIFVVVAGLLGTTPFGNTNTDIYYHLTVAKQIIAQGTVPAWDSWHFQPFGRPHIYPPLAHLAVALLSGFDVTEALSRVAAWQGLFYGILAMLFWWPLRKLFGAPAGFFMFAGLVMCFSFYSAAVSFMPSSIVIALMPLLFYLVVKKNIWGMTLVLATMLYAHPVFPWLIIAALVIFAMKNKAYKKSILYSVLLAVMVFMPWVLWRYITNWRWFYGFLVDVFAADKIGSYGIISHYVINFVWLALALYGGSVIYRRVWRERDLPEAQALFFRICFLALICFLPVFIFYGGRYLWLSGAILSIFVGWTLKIFLYDRLVGRDRSFRVAGAGLALFVMIIPLPLFYAQYISDDGRGVAWSVGAPVTVQAAGEIAQRISGRVDEEYVAYAEIAEIISDNTSPGEIVNVDLGTMSLAVPVTEEVVLSRGGFWEVNRRDIEMEVDDYARKNTLFTARPYAERDRYDCQEGVVEHRELFFGRCRLTD